jgi:hypothetical protein
VLSSSQLSRHSGRAEAGSSRSMTKPPHKHHLLMIACSLLFHAPPIDGHKHTDADIPVYQNKNTLTTHFCVLTLFEMIELGMRITSITEKDTEALTTHTDLGISYELLFSF